MHGQHRSIEIAASATVEVAPVRETPPQLDAGAWDVVRTWHNAFDQWDFTHPSALARGSPALDDFVAAEGIAPVGDPGSAAEVSARTTPT